MTTRASETNYGPIWLEGPWDASPPGAGGPQGGLGGDSPPESREVRGAEGVRNVWGAVAPQNREREVWGAASPPAGRFGGRQRSFWLARREFQPAIATSHDVMIKTPA